MFQLPDPDTLVMEGVRWGRPDVLFTPAYWAMQSQLASPLPQGGHRLGSTLKEEVVACLVGGHGIPAEVGIAAFRELVRAEVLNQPSVTWQAVFEVLHRPLTVDLRRAVRHRFALQKSKYIAEFLQSTAEPPTESPVQVRNWLLSFSGIGPKTASWIVRNWFDSDDVAILDIHILRAGQLAGVFPRGQALPKAYFTLEGLYLQFAKALAVRPSALDALIWLQMRQAGKLVLRLMQRYDGGIMRPRKTALRLPIPHPNSGDRRAKEMIG